MKELGGCEDEEKVVAGRTDNASVEKVKNELSSLVPPMYTLDFSPPFPVRPLYPNLQALVLTDPDLDSCPPVRPPPVNVSSSTEGTAPPPFDSTQSAHGPPYGSSTSCPMIEVMGAEGTALVYRQWTNEDIKNAADLLSNTEGDGERFVMELQAFCREMRSTSAEVRCVLAKKIKACELAVASPLPDPHLRLTSLNYNHTDNAQYHGAINSLCDKIKTKFPIKMDTNALRAVTQRPTEKVDDFMHHLEYVFNNHSSLKRPEGGGAPQQMLGKDFSAATSWMG